MGQNTLTAQQTATNFFLFIAVSKKKKKYRHGESETN